MSSKTAIDKAISEYWGEAMKYATLFHQSPDGILLIDTEGRFLDFNAAAHTQLGYARDEFVKLRLSDIDAVEAPEEIQKRINKVLSEGKAEFDAKYRTKRGEIRDVHVVTQVVSLSGQLVLHTLWRDITEQKKLEEALHRSEGKFRALFESTADALFIVDMNGSLVDVNGTAYERLGYTREEMLSMDLHKLNTADFRARIPERIEYVKKNGWGIFESEHLRKDGRVMPIEINARVIDFEGRKVIFSTVRDITERKKAEEAQRQNEKRYRRLFENANDAIFIIDVEGENAGRIVDANPVAATMHGYTIDELLKLNIEDIDSPGDAKLSPKRLELILKGEWLKAELKHRRKDGTIFPVEMTAGLFEEGGHKYVFAIERDITERKKTEETLQRFADIVQYTRIGITIGTEDGTLGLMNPAFAEMHGYTIDELYGKQIADIYAPEARTDLPGLIAKTHERGYHKFETLRLRKDGSVFPAEVEVYAIRDKEGRVIYRVTNVQDITERKKAEGKIMASLKEKEILLREIYHRTKNNMQVISGLLNLQFMSFMDSSMQEALKETQGRIRAISLVHERLYKSKDLSNLDIREYMEDLSAVMLNSYPEKSETVSLKLEVESLPLSIDLAIPCGLIIHELLSNSLKHAFPGNREGEIRIAMHENDGDEITLIYSDNGVGLPRGLDVRTTKTLGLRLVNNLVSGQLKGKLQVRIENGTGFQINFSRTEQ